MNQESNLVIEVAEKYPLAFKDMNIDLVNRAFSKNATKTGLMYNYEANNWEDLSTVGREELKKWVSTYNQDGLMPDGEVKTTVLDLQSKIAVVKIELEWAPKKLGCDYVFLVKEEKEWLIQKILWQSLIDVSN